MHVHFFIIWARSLIFRLKFKSIQTTVIHVKKYATICYEGVAVGKTWKLLKKWKIIECTLHRI